MISREEAFLIFNNLPAIFPERLEVAASIIAVLRGPRPDKFVFFEVKESP
jgi:hypothetical protein